MSKKIKFKIGEQYEKNEFELDWIKSVLDDNLRYEVYQYIGKDKITIFDCKVQKILLAYNCDFLSGVFYFVEGDYYFKILSEIQTESSYTRNGRINVIQISDSSLLLCHTNEMISKTNIIDNFKLLTKY